MGMKHRVDHGVTSLWQHKSPIGFKTGFSDEDGKSSNNA